MKDKKKTGKQKQNAPAQNHTSEGPRRRRLTPVNKTKYKINRYQLSEDFEDEDDLLYYDQLDDED
ncbi:hypothetical protein [Flavilitoribacter nigricans]|uniref:Uncharacterized protein n=1 Tax=Flavilitoribacter nigricans (strain ATCC 23147 / DSM 23189 / NBRC 102662 / NCIMB 1420 / SS-2) TaxID=1122177 RepID=A0A2D0NFU8_FLAN2|nr:hypothetical protein [Flavilitoribacter nigricans]PHN07374.1 hypothetical protein CRP01_07015 [Flavilitoribacter nigricans DSM 23189 = NBRC 102662]